MEVSDFMIREVWTCHMNDSLSHAAKLMWEHDCGCTPVLNDQGHVVGMLTDRDICMSAYSQGKCLHDVLVSTAMSGIVHAVRPAASVAEAEDIMREHRIRRLPVVDDSGRLAGILTLNDLALAAARETKGRKKGLTAADITQTLSSICAHPGRPVHASPS